MYRRRRAAPYRRRRTTIVRKKKRTVRKRRGTGVIALPWANKGMKKTYCQEEIFTQTPPNFAIYTTEANVTNFFMPDFPLEAKLWNFYRVGRVSVTLRPSIGPFRMQQNYRYDQGNWGVSYMNDKDISVVSNYESAMAQNAARRFNVFKGFTRSYTAMCQVKEEYKSGTLAVETIFDTKRFPWVSTTDSLGNIDTPRNVGIIGLGIWIPRIQWAPPVVSNPVEALGWNITYKFELGFKGRVTT